MITKLARLRQHMKNGEYSQALRLAASWPRLGDHRNAIQLGRAADVHPEFYRAIGRDPEALVAEGLAAIKERYGL